MSEQASLWEEVLAPRWVSNRALLVDGLSRHSEKLIDTFNLPPHSKVLDVGCGFGDTTLQWAGRVPQGRVVGLDLSPTFIDAAKKEAGDYASVTFKVEDAATHPAQSEYDLVYSRFGCMFFERPAAGFSKLHSMLKPRGQLLLQVWRAREHNPWFMTGKEEVSDLLGVPEDALTAGPGPFAMSDPGDNTQTLEAAGLLNVRHEQLDVDMPLGRDIVSAVKFKMSNGPVGHMIREAGDLPGPTLDKIHKTLADVLRPHQRSDGSVWLSSSSWVIIASP